MQGVYRVTSGGRELIETFVAAPGPMGWRYVGRLADQATGEHLQLVDYVVDVEWNLVRVRMADASGWEAIVGPIPGGLEAWTGTPEAERIHQFPGAVAVWTPSPCSLLAGDRRARIAGVWSFPAVVPVVAGEPEELLVSLKLAGHEAISTPAGKAPVEVVMVEAGNGPRKALVRRGLPIACEGRFELIG